MPEWIVDLLIAGIVSMAIFAVVAIGLYLVARRLFILAADRAARQIEDLLTHAARRASVAMPGRMSSTVAPSLADQSSTGFARYAQASGRDEAHVRREFQQTIEHMARLMDSLVKLPLVGPIGLDAVFGLFPFVGDATSAAVSLSLVARCLKYGLPSELVAKLLANVLADALVGTVPLVGDLADIWFRANQRNAALVREYLDKHP